MKTKWNRYIAVNVIDVRKHYRDIVFQRSSFFWTWQQSDHIWLDL